MWASMYGLREIRNFQAAGEIYTNFSPLKTLMENLGLTNVC